MAPPGFVARQEPHRQPRSNPLLTCQCPSVPFLSLPGLRGNLSVIPSVTIQLPWRKRVDKTKNASNSAFWSSSSYIRFLVFSALTRRICSEKLGFLLFLPKHFCRAFRGSREASISSVLSPRAPAWASPGSSAARPVPPRVVLGDGNRRGHGHAAPPSRGPRSPGAPLASLSHRFTGFFLPFIYHPLP